MYLKRIRELREDRDYTQKDISSLLEITQPQYVLYESGKRDMPFELIIKLCEFYNVSSDYIGNLTNTMKPYPRIKK